MANNAQAKKENLCEALRGRKRRARSVEMLKHRCTGHADPHTGARGESVVKEVLTTTTDAH